MNTIKLTNEEIRQLEVLVSDAGCFVDMNDELNWTVFDQLQEKIAKARCTGTSEEDVA